jgi:hypothetical protein
MRRFCYVFIILFMILIDKSQGQCVLDEIQAHSIDGYLLHGYEGRYRTIDNAEVLVLDNFNRHKILARSNVDKNGHFQFKRVKPGKYYLSGRSPDLISASVEIQVLRERSGRMLAESSILIVLSADGTKECGGSSITLETKTTIDEILKTRTKRNSGQD